MTAASSRACLISLKVRARVRARVSGGGVGEGGVNVGVRVRVRVRVRGWVRGWVGVEQGFVLVRQQRGKGEVGQLGLVRVQPHAMREG